MKNILSSRGLAFWVVSLSFLFLAYASADTSAPQSFLTPWDAIQDKTFNVDRSEWWYNIGFLSGTNQSGQKRHFGFMVNIVRGSAQIGSTSPLQFPVTGMDIALLDLDHKTHYTYEEITSVPDFKTFSILSGLLGGQSAIRGNLSLEGTFQTRFKVGGKEGTHRFFIDLLVVPRKNQAEFGDHGIVDGNILGKALYVSRTRQEVTPGSFVQLDEETIYVTGMSWEDHQLTAPRTGPNLQIKWSWFAILLKDGTEVMAFQIENLDTGQIIKNYAGHVLKDGKVDNFDDHFQISEQEHTDYTGIHVPSAWAIALPSVFSTSIENTVPLPSVATTAHSKKGAYFEGPCNIKADYGETKAEAVWCEYFDTRLFQ